MRAVFLDFGSVTRGDMDCTALEQAISRWHFYDETTTDQVAERIKDAEVVVCNKFSLDRRAIFSAKRLKLICVAATGVNNIDLAVAVERNIPVCNVRAYATPSVVQHVFMLILNLARHFVEYRQLVKNDLASEYENDIRIWIDELLEIEAGSPGFLTGADQES